MSAAFRAIVFGQFTVYYFIYKEGPAVIECKYNVATKLATAANISLGISIIIILLEIYYVLKKSVDMVNGVGRNRRNSNTEELSEKQKCNWVNVSLFSFIVL